MKRAPPGDSASSLHSEACTRNGCGASTANVSATASGYGSRKGSGHNPDSSTFSNRSLTPFRTCSWQFGKLREARYAHTEVVEHPLPIAYAQLLLLKWTLPSPLAQYLYQRMRPDLRHFRSSGVRFAVLYTPAPRLLVPQGTGECVFADAMFVGGGAQL